MQKLPRWLPVYTVIQQKAILGISNLLPSDKAMLVRIPYFGKKGVEKYGDVILEMVRVYRKEKKDWQSRSCCSRICCHPQPASFTIRLHHLPSEHLLYSFLQRAAADTPVPGVPFLYSAR